MADFVVLELLRMRSLEVDVVALALAEAGFHLARRHVERLDRREVEPAAVAGVLEHRERLPSVVHQDARTA